MTTDEKDPRIVELREKLNTRVSAAFLTGRLSGLEEVGKHVADVSSRFTALEEFIDQCIEHTKAELEEKKNLIP